MTRLPAGIPARLVVTDLLGQTTTWLQKSLLAATYTPSLNQPMLITADVRSGDQAVNMVFPPDGFPLVAQSNRLIYALLEESPGTFTCRGAGIIMSPQDQGDTDTSTTHLTAYDGWQWFLGQPCFVDAVGTPIPPGGVPYYATGDDIAMTLIGNTLQSLIALGFTGPGYGGLVPGFGLVDIPASYGGAASSGLWAGTQETTPFLDWLVQQGTTLGDALTQLASAGNDTTGTSLCIDIIFEPIYDPRNRPGYINQVSIYHLAGSEKPAAPMGWGCFNRTATTADREHDGTPGSFINVANFFAGQGGTPIPFDPTVNEAPDSIATYYPSMSTQFFPSALTEQQVTPLAVQAITLYKQGKRTFLVDVDPLRGALPGRDYNIGDRVPVLSTDAQRIAATGFQRVQAIPVQINSDGVTSVKQLLTSPDWPGDENTDA